MPLTCWPRRRDPGETGRHQANWYGLAGYVMVTPMDKMQLNLRGEWFDDPDGTQTGVKQTLWEVTPTFSYALADHLTFRDTLLRLRAQLVAPGAGLDSASS